MTPVLPSARGKCREAWLVLPGWGQSGAHWTPVARWLQRAGVALLWADMKSLAESAPGERGTLERLRAVAAQVGDSCARRRVAVLIAHSAAATTAALCNRGGLRALTLVEPVPSHFGFAPLPVSAPLSMTPHPPPRPTRPRSSVVDESSTTAGRVTRARFDELYPFASAEALRQIATACGSYHGETLSGTGLGSPGGAPGRAEAAGHALHEGVMPVRIVCGAASAVCPQDLAERMCAGAPPGSRLHVVQRAGHSPHIDQPRQVAEILLRAAQHLDRSRHWNPQARSPRTRRGPGRMLSADAASGQSRISSRSAVTRCWRFT